jgi:hypothetical protein
VKVSLSYSLPLELGCLVCIEKEPVSDKDWHNFNTKFVNQNFKVLIKIVFCFILKQSTFMPSADVKPI